MAAITIRNLDETVKNRLRIRAAEHGLSMEEEVRTILRREFTNSAEAGGLGSELVAEFRDAAVDLPLPSRSVPREPIDFDASG
mgnify:CR=1 FL=1